jgi:predicted ester cyclase
VRRALPDHRSTITTPVAGGDRAATVRTLRGTHRGEWGPTAGSVAPTGRPVAFTATTTLRVAGGREEGAATLRAVGRV